MRTAINCASDVDRGGSRMRIVYMRAVIVEAVCIRSSRKSVKDARLLFAPGVRVVVLPIITIMREE